MPAKKPKPNKKAKAKSQAERFVEFAKMGEVDETGETFRRALGKVVPAKRQAKGAP